MNMDDDFDLRDFSNNTRLFPVPNVVLFPHVVLPLHIFEPRYRQMTEDALASDGLVTIVNVRPTPSPSTLGHPPIERVGGLGRILQPERLEEGRFNFLLLGWKRVLIEHEIVTGKLYRSAKVEIIEDDCVDDRELDPLRNDLVELFRAVFERQNQLDSDLGNLLQKTVPMGVITDIIGHALGLPPEIKQSLLNEPNVERRGENLVRILRQVISHDPKLAGRFRPFPPPFSLN